MAIDSTGIESQIDSNLPDNTKRRNDASVVRFLLKSVVRWVRDAVNNNLSTWVLTSNGLPGGGNTDDISRVGVTRFKGGIEAYTRTTDNKMLALVAQDQAGMRVSSQNGGPSYIELHHPGNRIDKLGTDQDGVLKFGPWGQVVSFPVFISGLTALLALPNILANRKISLYDGGSEHQFFGFGVNADTLRYQILQASASHVFFAGTSPVTSAELMRITGTGRVGIGTSAPGFRLDVQVENPDGGILAQFQNTRSSGGNGALMQIHHAGVGIWRYGIAPGVDAFIIQGYGGGTFPERLRIDTNGNTGIGTNAPTAKLHVRGANGFDQLRLENKYTPSGPGDANGQVGSVCWDDTWFYLKTTVGWRRMQLQSW